MAAELDTIGRRIRYARKAKGMTAKDVATAMDVSTAQMIKYETGANRLPSTRLASLAAILDVSALWLLYGPENALAGLHGRFLKLSAIRQEAIARAWDQALRELES